MESWSVNSGFCPRILTISSTPKYSVVPGSILEFVAARLLLGAWIFELLTQLDLSDHPRETLLVVFFSFHLLDVFELSTVLCVSVQIFWFSVWFTISFHLFSTALNNVAFFIYVNE